MQTHYSLPSASNLDLSGQLSQKPNYGDNFSHYHFFSMCWSRIGGQLHDCIFSIIQSWWKNEINLYDLWYNILCVSDSGPGPGNNVSLLGKDCYYYSVPYKFHFQNKALISKSIHSEVWWWYGQHVGLIQIKRSEPWVGSFIVSVLGQAPLLSQCPSPHRRETFHPGWQGRGGGGRNTPSNCTNAWCYVK